MYCLMDFGLFLFSYFNTKIELKFGNWEQTDGLGSSYKYKQGNFHTLLQNLNNQGNGQER